MVKLTRDFRPAESWTFPKMLLDKFELMSNSGGSSGRLGDFHLREARLQHRDRGQRRVARPSSAFERGGWPFVPARCYVPSPEPGRGLGGASSERMLISPRTCGTAPF